MKKIYLVIFSLFFAAKTKVSLLIIGIADLESKKLLSIGKMINNDKITINMKYPETTSKEHINRIKNCIYKSSIIKISPEEPKKVIYVSQQNLFKHIKSIKNPTQTDMNLVQNILQLSNFYYAWCPTLHSNAST